MRWLVDSIFGEGQWGDNVWMAGRAVLAAHNEEVDRVNDDVFAWFPAHGPYAELFSANSTEEEDEEAVFPVDF